MEFQAFRKIPRWSRNIVITEKIDGTNACIGIDENGVIFAGRRTSWIAPGTDNFGFRAWVEAHTDELQCLGPGRHFGEWWGAGIQRRYGMTERVFSLFDPMRYSAERGNLPSICRVVPLLHHGPMEESAINGALRGLLQFGSMAAPGFMDPEGIVVFHKASGTCFKKTLYHDEAPKSEVEADGLAASE